MNLDSRIEQLKDELARLENRKARGPLTFAQWEESSRWYRNDAVIRVGAYGVDDVGRDVSYRRDVAGPEYEFLPGERPVVMRGAFLNMTNGGDYKAVQYYVSKVLSRYVQRWEKPTIFFRDSWRAYWRGVCGMYSLKHRGRPDPEAGDRPVRYMGRREPYFIYSGQSWVGDVGLDAAAPNFMIRGKVFEVCPGSSTDVISARVRMLTQFAKQSEKLEELDRRIAMLR